MLNGLARLLNAYGDEIKDDTFKEKLGRLSTKQMCREAKDRRAGSLGFAEAMLLYYNKKSRSPLKWEKLYTHKTARRRAAQEIPDEENSETASEEMGQLNIFDAEDEVSE